MAAPARSADPHTSTQTGSVATTPFFASGLTTLALKYPAPAVAQYSLGVQHELTPSVIWVVQYVGNLAWHQNDQRNDWRDNDHQLEPLVEIYQGEGREVKSNVKLGSLTVPVPPQPAGEVGLECRFSYDTSGLLEVDIKVPASGLSSDLHGSAEYRAHLVNVLAQRAVSAAG